MVSIFTDEEFQAALSRYSSNVRIIKGSNINMFFVCNIYLGGLPMRPYQVEDELTPDKEILINRGLIEVCRRLWPYRKSMTGFHALMNDFRLSAEQKNSLMRELTKNEKWYTV